MRLKRGRGAESNSPFLFVDPVLILFLFMVMIVASLLILPKEEEKTETPRLSGSIFVSIYWSPDLPQDIDLWLRGPDGEPVGYSSPSSSVFSYLRDDLGESTYKTLNYEFAVAQNLLEGEYIINLHFYSYHGGGENVPVEVSILTNSPGQFSTIFDGTVVLGRMGDEITVARFELNNNGALIPESLNSDFISIRVRRSQFE